MRAAAGPLAPLASVAGGVALPSRLTLQSLADPMSVMRRQHCEMRFYGELNAFIAPALRGFAITHAFDGTPTAKDRIESLGVPHTEVDLIVVDDALADFSHRLTGGERVAVYPRFGQLGLPPTMRLQPPRPEPPGFVLDVHLGRLAAFLRLLGIDCCYRNDYDDESIIALSVAERRIVLTRDTGILKHRRVIHGAFVHATVPMMQVREVLDRFDLAAAIRPLSRCMACNGGLQPVAAATVMRQVPAAVLEQHSSFRRCPACERVYWQGGHIERLRKRFAEIGVALRDPGDPADR